MFVCTRSRHLFYRINNSNCKRTLHSLLHFIGNNFKYLFFRVKYYNMYIVVNIYIIVLLLLNLKK